MKKRIYVICLGLIGLVAGCTTTQKDPEPLELNLSISVADKWAEMTLNHLKVQQLKTPTYVSRSLGYIGLTMYETVVNGSVVYQSVAPQLNGLGTLPKPEKDKLYDWETSLNAGQAYIIKQMWQHAMAIDNKRLDSLESAIYAERNKAVTDTATLGRSKRYGLSIAKAIYEWSKTDGGHLGYLTNFDAKYVFPRTNTNWTPPLNGQSSVLLPMHAHWGKNRTFTSTNSQLPVPEMIPYSDDKNSAFFKDFKEVYDIQLALTQEQKEIANWWGDDPSDTFAPPGHSYSLALQILRLKKPTLFVAAQSFAKVGMSVADAFINCWKCKYTYHSVRPTPYIRRNINGAFVQYWPEPPFPAFASGHATQASSAAEALISIYGDNVTFDDMSHVGRPKDVFRNVEYKKRSFTSISQTAIECGISRLYGGIHTAQDNIVGLAEGKKIGANINALSWKK
jgi:membrane-associated phospholipid phosphatase